MNRIARAAVAVAMGSALAGTGCYKNTYVTGAGTGGGAYTQKASFFLWGLVGRHTVDMNQVCPDGVGWFQNRWTFGDGFVGCITFGIYQPVTIEVRCNGGQAWMAVPDLQEGLTWFYELDEDGQLSEAALAELHARAAEQGGVQ